jgi:hypothetical protein
LMMMQEYFGLMQITGQLGQQKQQQEEILI